MPCFAHDETVAHTGGGSVDGDGRKLAQGAQGPSTGEVEVEKDATVVVENKVAEGIGALDDVGVGGKGGEEPRVMFLPHHVSISLRCKKRRELTERKAMARSSFQR